MDVANIQKATSCWTFVVCFTNHCLHSWTAIYMLYFHVGICWTEPHCDVGYLQNWKQLNYFYQSALLYRLDDQKSIFYRSNKELAEVPVVGLWFDLFVIFKVLIVSFTCGDGDMRVAVTKFIPVVFDFKEKFGNLPFTFTGLQEANSLLLR